jgi:hypothetical protein
LETIAEGANRLAVQLGWDRTLTNNVTAQSG